MIDQLGVWWQALLDFTAKLVMPDWGWLISMLPVFVLIGVVGPLLSLLLLYWLVYGVLKPRTAVRFETGPSAAPLAADGTPVFPVGEPYSARTGLVYPPGTTRDDVGDPLVVTCPKCGLGRSAEIDTCGSCGLILRIAPRARTIRPAGPPPGGATIA